VSLAWTGSNASLERFDGHENMRRDASLLDAAEKEGRLGWRVYGWAGPWVSLGMLQDPTRDLLDPDLIPWVMRPTGGKAVLHGHDITVGMAVPLALISERTRESEERLARSVKTVYRWIIAPIVEALRECGLPASLAENTRFGAARIRHPNPLPEGRGELRNQQSEIRNPTSPDCFGHVSPNDVVDERTGQKVCGCALRLTRRAVLLQASIPAGPPLLDPRRVFAHAALAPPPKWDATAFREALSEALRAKRP